VVDDERRTKPLSMILEVLANPFARSLGKRPNEGKRALWQNPDVGFAAGAVHAWHLRLRSSFFSGNRRAKFLRIFPKERLWPCQLPPLVS
jgi:hypothetical protein